MPIMSLFLATFGVSLLVLLATNSFGDRPGLKRLEPMLAVISLMFVFSALLAATSNEATITPALAASSYAPTSGLD
ncbi:MAG: hypothetical protein JJ868_14915 [Shimia sp.]|uniref:hypothetical protein n=1 Tax=Shimia sp. TaxID=1954381 RepID=UPI001B1E3FA5|nr:hypothetical protein [Shimia sp.]MBO6898662.1 hypothetical protein [Shimia sp.]